MGQQAWSNVQRWQYKFTSIVEPGQPPVQGLVWIKNGTISRLSPSGRARVSMQPLDTVVHRQSGSRADNLRRFNGNSRFERRLGMGMAAWALSRRGDATGAPAASHGSSAAWLETPKHEQQKQPLEVDFTREVVYNSPLTPNNVSSTFCPPSSSPRVALLGDREARWLESAAHLSTHLSHPLAASQCRTKHVCAHGGCRAAFRASSAGVPSDSMPRSLRLPAATVAECSRLSTDVTRRKHDMLASHCSAQRAGLAL